MKLTVFIFLDDVLEVVDDEADVEEEASEPVVVTESTVLACTQRAQLEFTVTQVSPLWQHELPEKLAPPHWAHSLSHDSVLLVVVAVAVDEDSEVDEAAESVAADCVDNSDMTWPTEDV